MTGSPSSTAGTDGTASTASTIGVACLGDVMLDVMVNAPQGLVPDDDTPAGISFTAGGQAANVAAWVVALGGTACVVGPRSEQGHGPIVTTALRARGVEVRGPVVERAGAVVSLVQTGTRSMASDAGDTTWLTRLDASELPAAMDWLHVSGYALLRCPTPWVLTSFVAAARGRGGRHGCGRGSRAGEARPAPAP